MFRAVNVKRIRLLATVMLSLLILNCTGAAEMSKKNRELSATSWWVEDIAGKGVVDRSHTTIEFDGAGGVFGDSGCNRYFGTFTVNADEISFGPLAGTRKACAGALMDQETRFYRAMELSTSWEVAETGLLYLRDENAVVVIRAVKTEPAARPE